MSKGAKIAIGVVVTIGLGVGIFFIAKSIKDKNAGKK
jgi:hypothetical protein